jgi:hypothetical protein
MSTFFQGVDPNSVVAGGIAAGFVVASAVSSDFLGILYTVVIKSVAAPALGRKIYAAPAPFLLLMCSKIQEVLNFDVASASAKNYAAPHGSGSLTLDISFNFHVNLFGIIIFSLVIVWTYMTYVAFSLCIILIKLSSLNFMCHVMRGYGN